MQQSMGLCHGNRNPLAVKRQDGFPAQAAVAVLQVSNASPLRTRSALRDVGWRGVVEGVVDGGMNSQEALS
jgi:hypothetical protein